MFEKVGLRKVHASGPQTEALNLHQFFPTDSLKIDHWTTSIPPKQMMELWKNSSNLKGDTTENFSKFMLQEEGKLDGFYFPENRIDFRELLSADGCH